MCLQEEFRLQRDVQAAEERSAADEAARKQRLKDTIASIDRSNKAQLAAKAQARQRAAQEEAEIVRAWEVSVCICICICSLQSIHWWNKCTSGL